jgi:hypothetical protein
MKEILAANKYDTLVLGKIQKHMLSREAGPRDMTRLHPSEMCKTDWCPRQSYYRVSGEHEELVKETERSYVLENIFDEGHAVHDKYQQRLWSMGLLRGFFKCYACDTKWEDISPTCCVYCGASRQCLSYKEVPLSDEVHGIIGHADGDIDLGGPAEDDPLLEVKTIGVGTVRHENPGLLYDYTLDVDGKSVVDLDGMWQSIKRPFPSHIRQGMLYLAIKGRKRMVFIYECKWNQQTKEFVLRFRPEIVEPLLDLALDVQHALKVHRPPARPGWADPDNDTCMKCVFRDVCYDLENEHGDEEPGADTGGRGGGGAEGAAPVGDAPAPEAAVQRGRRGGGRPAEGAAAPVRVVRRRADAADGRPDPVD